MTRGSRIPESRLRIGCLTPSLRVIDPQAELHRTVRLAN